MSCYFFISLKIDKWKFFIYVYVYVNVYVNIYRFKEIYFVYIKKWVCLDSKCRNIFV